VSLLKNLGANFIIEKFHLKLDNIADCSDVVKQVSFYCQQSE